MTRASLQDPCHTAQVHGAGNPGSKGDHNSSDSRRAGHFGWAFCTVST